MPRDGRMRDEGDRANAKHWETVLVQSNGKMGRFSEPLVLKNTKSTRP